MDDTRERRRNYFIKKQFQARFIIKFCALVMVGTLISGAIIYYMSTKTVTTTFENSRLTIKSTADFILPSLLLASAVVVILIGLATIAVTLFTSHKIAGPLYRMEKDVEDVSSGNLQKRFTLRRTDEIKVLAQALDDMTQSLRNDIGSIKMIAAELETMLDSADKQASKEKLRQIKAIVDRFKT